MAKSNILKEIANNEISLDIAINRLLLISSDLENNELFNWCLKELNGYELKDQVPVYRLIVNSNIVYTGVNGNFQITKQPLPLSMLPPIDLDNLLKHKFCEGVNTLVRYSVTTEELSRDLTYYANHVFRVSGIQCISIKQVYDSSNFNMITEKIRTLLLTIFMKLDKELGNLDSLDISSTSLNESQFTDLNNDLLEYIEFDNCRETIGESQI